MNIIYEQVMGLLSIALILSFIVGGIIKISIKQSCKKNNTRKEKE